MRETLSKEMRISKHNATLQSAAVGLSWAEQTSCKTSRFYWLLDQSACSDSSTSSAVIHPLS
jgi:hypothetical protein